MKSESLKKAARYFGIVCAVLALGAVGYLLATGDWQTIRSSFGFAPFLLAATSYLSGALALAVSWALGLGGPFLLLMAIYGRSSLGKYLPGNVGHFVLRQTELGRLGVRQWTIAGASLEEIITQIAAALLLVGVAILWIGPDGQISVAAAQFDLHNWLNVLAGMTIGIALLLISVLTWQTLFSARRFVGRLFWAVSFEGAGFLLLIQLVPLEVALSAIGVFSLAWLGGFVAFGAPGGIGVREAIIAALLANIIGADGAAALAVVLRLACVAGDTLFAGITQLAMTQIKPNGANTPVESTTAHENRSI